MLLYQFAIGAANDVVDAPDDALAKPSKPIPAGLISGRTATVIAVVCAGGGLIVTAPMDLVPWLIGLAGLGCGLVYDISLKRTPLSWLPLSLALPLVPAWVFSAAGAWEPFLWIAFPAGVLFGAAIHLANELPDVAAAPSSRGAAHLAGPRRAYLGALALFGAATSLIAVVLAFVAPLNAILAATAGAMAFVLAPRATRLFGRSGLFGILATTTGVIAVVFVAAL
jgi:4-hydroxybenzoate polyprenyltransferase